MAGHGRPLKGKTKRAPITVHAAVGMIEMIDEYVKERKQQQERAYSRSDFYNEAAVLYLKHAGYFPEEETDEEKTNRTKSVPKKTGERNTMDNMNNSNNENQEK